jgi:hypothetical protein
MSFAVYRSGERLGPLITLPFDQYGSGPSPAETAVAQQAAALVDSFLAYRAVAPPSLTALAERLAPLCAVLRDEVRRQLDVDTSEVHKASVEFRDALFPDRTLDEIADAFAQTCTYSMLLARSHGATELSSASVEAALRHAHPVLGRVVRILLDDDTEAEIGWAVDTVRALIEAVNFDSLRGGRRLPGMPRLDDTWLYFYEAFLAAYDPELRDQYGVYYTPKEVIRAQTAMVQDILRSQLGKRRGFASPDVTLIDPGVGTGSYPIQAVDAAAAIAKETLGAGAVPQVLSGLAANLYAFEVLVGPYSVAHLRISEALEDHGAPLPDHGVNVYLADTLASPHAEPKTFARILDPLIEEQRKAVRVKEEVDILVCVGNPPYERAAGSAATETPRGGWVVHGDEQKDYKPIFESFLAPARAGTVFSHIASLYNDYVYFWRWAIWKVFEAPGLNGESNGRAGVVSFISASSYIDGPGFIGMREHMRRMCDEIYVLDLGGEGHGTRQEQNVFAIRTPVAVCVAMRSGDRDPAEPATTWYARLSGTRAEKLSGLAAITSVADVTWHEVSDGWQDPFIPALVGDYGAWPRITQLFPWQQPGTKVGRTWPIATTRACAEQRWLALVTAPVEERSQLFGDAPHGRRASTQPQFAYPAPASLEPIARLDESSKRPPVTRYALRSLDRQWIVADARVMRTPSQPLWWAHGPSQLYLTSLLTDAVGHGPTLMASGEVPDLHHFSGRGGKDVIPLWRDPDGTQANITAGLLDLLSAEYGATVTPERFFTYVYGVLTTPQYAERFFEELASPPSRVAIVRDFDLFQQAAALGEKLLRLHTFGKAFPTDQDLTGHARWVDGIPPTEADYPNDFAYDAETQTLHIGGAGRVAPVTPDAWGYSVSGHEPIRSWLRYRMRAPAGRARASRSRLDRMRPTVWPQEFTEELIELVWTIEATVALVPEQDALLGAILTADVFKADDLPSPSTDETRPPKTAAPPKPSTGQTEIAGL